MSRSTKMKNLAAISVAAVMGVAVQSAFAHTGPRDKAVEGVSAYNAIAIGHTCEIPGTETSRPIIAQSVVFPTVNPHVYRADNLKPMNLENVIEQGSLVDLPQLIQDKSIFTKQDEKTNTDGQVIGFYGAYGNLQHNLRGIVPFRMGAVNFVPDSCAKTLLVNIAIADICTRVFPPKPGTANLWIPNTTPKFSDPAIDGIGKPATLAISRDLVANPLKASCGAGYEVVVSPSDQDIDQNLKIRNYWPGTGL